MTGDALTAEQTNATVETVDLLSRAADALDAALQGATDGPWWVQETDQCWTLHGVHATLPAQGSIPPQVIGAQILKAPKTGTPYAEYWPNRADGKRIPMMSNPAVARALAVLLRSEAAGLHAALGMPALLDAAAGQPTGTELRVAYSTIPELVQVARAVLAAEVQP